jgi:hypothetical protein
MANVIEREPIDVWYVATASGENASAAFQELEAKLETLRGRKFYGAFYLDSDEYRACVEVLPDEDLGLSRETLPGGRFRRSVLRGEPPELYSRIAPAFEELVAGADSDPTRPSLEFYRRRDEVVLLLPIRG